MCVHVHVDNRAFVREHTRRLNVMHMGACRVLERVCWKCLCV